MATVRTFHMCWGFLLISVGGKEGLLVQKYTFSVDFCRILYEFEKVYFAPNMRDFELVVCKAKLFR